MTGRDGGGGPGPQAEAAEGAGREVAVLLARAERAGLPAEVLGLLARDGAEDRSVREAVARWVDDRDAEEAFARLLPELLAAHPAQPPAPPPPRGTDHPGAWRAERLRGLRAAAEDRLSGGRPGDGVALLERGRTRAREDAASTAAEPGRRRFLEAVARVGGGAGIPALLDEERDALLRARDPAEAARVLAGVEARLRRWGEETRRWVERRLR